MVGAINPRSMRVLISAATPNIPTALIEQLADKGRLVAPVGERESQDLIVLNKNGDKDGETKNRKL